jgi:hypothetical protein
VADWSLTYPFLSKRYLEVQQDEQWLLAGLQKEIDVEYKEEGGVACEIIEKCFCETTNCRAWARYICYIRPSTKNSARVLSLSDKRSGTCKTQKATESINQNKKTNLTKQEHPQV